MRRQGKEQIEPLFDLESKEEKNFPPWAWALLIAVSFLLRSFRFWAFPRWPLTDETNTFQAALELSKHWTWDFFKSEGQSPPLLDWATGALFKISDHVFFALLFPPFLVSCLTFLMIFWTARRFLPGTLAFIATAFFALSYWPLYSQGFALQAVCLPLWEIGVLFLLARGLEERELRPLWIFALGAWTGLGYWTYSSWPVVAIAAFSILLMAGNQRGWRGRASFLFIMGCITTGFYFLIAITQNGGYGTHFLGYSAFSGWFSEKQILLSDLDYVNCLFWGQWSEGSYFPVQGGFLNPLISAFFWIGIWEIFGWKTLPPFSRWAGPLLVLFLLPGLLSQNLQCLRVIQAIPLVLGLSALGACRFLAAFPMRGRPALLGLLLLASLSWDATRLKATLEPLAAQNAQIRVVYGVLEKIARDRGPGMILTQFKVQNHPEENLEAAVYPFNSVDNRRWDIHRAGWAALLLHPDEVPFLQGDFPETQWWKPPVVGTGDESLEIGFIPIVAREGPRFEKWVEANQWFQKGDLEFTNVSNSQSYQEAIQYWLRPPPFMAGDRFLQTCYWERLSEFYYHRGFEIHYDLQVDALKRAVTDGYPATHLYFDLGCLLMRKGNYIESRRALETALRSEPNNSDIKNALRLLDEMEKQKSFHS